MPRTEELVARRERRSKNSNEVEEAEHGGEETTALWFSPGPRQLALALRIRTRGASLAAQESPARAMVGCRPADSPRPLTALGPGCDGLFASTRAVLTYGVLCTVVQIDQVASGTCHLRWILVRCCIPFLPGSWQAVDRSLPPTTRCICLTPIAGAFYNFLSST
ncbi:hypothetical protein BO71DRAFT_18216 [Aspergillus ellipticus CBS 707.79]|uniref:Uncharacterized protein n=1 Tax=Aspergillus ellipticus CBS 707.79 TaxID=1448320 RepID=A0A319DWX8_9EURO|nr:hypothetical protein BO71DRAFT_18216 [Aspergillus ellipticus CBS 707.79]